MEARIVASASMSSEPIHLFLNPAAGRGRAAKRQAGIQALLQQGAFPFEVHLSEACGDLEQRVANAISTGARRILVAGGDGSVHEAANAVLKSGGVAALGVIPSGTGNDFAKACDIPLNWEHATRLLTDRIAANETPRRIDAAKMNSRYFVNGAGVGLDAKVTQVAQSIRWPMGDLVYLLAIFKTMIGGITTPSLTISANDFAWNGPVTLVAISNGSSLGGMFQIAPMANNADGQLEMLLAKPVTRRRILSLLPKLMDGTHVGEHDIVHQSITSLTIRSSEPLPSHLDGEVQPLQTDFEISLLPASLKLL